jgi:hypothetical protein
MIQHPPCPYQPQNAYSSAVDEGDRVAPFPFDTPLSALLDRCLTLGQDARDLRRLVEEVAL